MYIEQCKVESRENDCAQQYPFDVRRLTTETRSDSEIQSARQYPQASRAASCRGQVVRLVHLSRGAMVQTRRTGNCLNKESKYRVASRHQALIRAHRRAAAETAAGSVIPVARPEVGAGTHLLVAVLVTAAAAASASAGGAERRAPRLARGRVQGRRLGFCAREETALRQRMQTSQFLSHECRLLRARCPPADTISNRAQRADIQDTANRADLRNHRTLLRKACRAHS